ncbi:uncharacterized protein LOC119735862 [Patiria miniata]|uniref:Uncharacterized protein n=1 Tax=Patiria miniata TaxID=46514 RepID=A0A914AQL1_PATMI|nr:uncharacterized protein LOC119735862 [Patiria miniata]
MSIYSDDTDGLHLLQTYIEDTLPSLKREQVCSILDKCLEVGVDKPTDFKYVSEGDLSELNLKKVQLRKLLSAFDASDPDAASLETQHKSPSGVLPSASSPSHTSSGWSTDYSVPWDKMPAALQKDLQRKERPLPSTRRQMVRIIVDDISAKITHKPGRKHLCNIASKIVCHYPHSFQDQLGGTVIGRGYDSLLSQLETRIANITRVTKPTRAVHDIDSDSGAERPAKKIKASTSYSTQNWQPDLPHDEDVDSQNDKKIAMLTMHSKEVWDKAAVAQLLSDTYSTLRSVINSGATSILTIEAEWPFLFEEIGMLEHFEKLYHHS